MTDSFSRMRQIIGTTAEWASNDLVIGYGEVAIERAGPGALTYKLKIGDGVSPFSALAYTASGADDMPKSGGTFIGPIELNTANVDIGFRPTDGTPGSRVWYHQANDDGSFVLVAAADDYSTPVATYHYDRTGAFQAPTIGATTSAFVPNRPAGDSDTHAANTAFVTAAISTIMPGPGGPGGQVIRDITVGAATTEILLYNLGVKSAQVFFRLVPSTDGASIFSQFATNTTLYTGNTYVDSNLFGTGTTASFAQVGPAAANKLSSSQSNAAALIGTLTIPWIGAAQMHGVYAGAIGTTGALISFSTGFFATGAGSPNGIRLSVSPGQFAVGSTARVIGWP